VPESLRARLAGTNINPDTLLATDYLNHFNEIIMMLELVADMPEMLADAKAWKPIGYAEHFRYSQFAERDLAIEVYDLIPEARRKGFEDAIAQTHARIAAAIAELSDALASDPAEHLRRACAAAARDLHRLIDQISVIIHGGAMALDQPDIDGILAADAPAATPTLGQDDIDNLFK
jgi:hypothetical protein